MCAGVIVYAFGVTISVQANMGIAPWDCLSMGISYHMPFSYGTVHTVIGFLCLLAGYLMGERIGLGTILDTLIAGNAVDLFLALNVIPKVENPVIGAIVLIPAMLVMAFGIWMCMGAGLSCGPRDTLYVALTKRMPKLSGAAVELIMLGAVLALGLVFGGPVGIGTVECWFGISIAMGLVFRLMKFEPKNVRHESLTESLMRLKRK